MQQATAYRYRIEHAASRVVTFTPWRSHPAIGQQSALADILSLSPSVPIVFDEPRSRYVATDSDGREAFLFALETRRAGA